MENRKFGEVYNSADKFYNDYLNFGIATTIKEASCKNLFYLLYAKFANSHFANRDEVQAKLKIFTTIFKYGPTWEKRLEIQKSLRDLDLSDLQEGSRQISNHAANPNTAPSTAALEELDYIDDQTSVNYKKNKVDAYTTLWNMLATDVTEEFLSRFNRIFAFASEEEEIYLYKEEI